MEALQELRVQVKERVVMNLQHGGHGISIARQGLIRFLGYCLGFLVINDLVSFVYGGIEALNGI